MRNCGHELGDKENIPPIWEPIPLPEGILAEDEDAPEWEVAIPKIHYSRLCNWQKHEYNKWKQLLSQGRGIESFEIDNISNWWITRYRGIPHRKLVTVLQLRAKAYPI